MSEEKEVRYPEDAQKMENILNALGVTAYAIAKETGYTYGALYHVRKGINSLSSEMADRMVDAYPILNIRYLKFGELPVVLSKNEVIRQSRFLKDPHTKETPTDAISAFIEIPDR